MPGVFLMRGESNNSRTAVQGAQGHRNQQSGFLKVTENLSENSSTDGQILWEADTTLYLGC
jgi:hypothetical protein